MASLTKVQVIENFQRDPMSLRISLHMIHSSNDPEVRHFGYSVLDSHVKSQWVILDEHKKLSSALNDDQKIQIKNALLEEIYSVYMLCFLNDLF